MKKDHGNIMQFDVKMRQASPRNGNLHTCELSLACVLGNDKKYYRAMSA